jgi:hypothetical protein
LLKEVCTYIHPLTLKEAASLEIIIGNHISEIVSDLKKAKE